MLSPGRSSTLSPPRDPALRYPAGALAGQKVALYRLPPDRLLDRVGLGTFDLTRT
jgi:hypothetical protein